MLDKHKISEEQRILEKIVFSDMYYALLENDTVVVSCPKEQDPLIDALSKTEKLEDSNYIMHEKNECCPKMELLVTEIESLREQVKSHEHYVQSLENTMKATVDILIGKTQKIWEQNEVQNVKVNLNHQRLNDMDIWIKSGLQNTVKQIEATNLFVDQVNAKVVSDAEHIHEIYEILKTEELRKSSEINVRMQLLKDLHEQLKLNIQNMKSMYDVLKEGEEEAVADITEERNSTELNKYLVEIRRLLVDETEVNYNAKVNTLQETNDNDDDHMVKEQQDNMIKEQDNTVEEKENNNVIGQQDNVIKEVQNIVKEQQNNTLKELQDNIVKQHDNTVKEQQNAMIKEQQYNTAKGQQDNNVKERKNNAVKDMQDNMVKELKDNMLKEQQDNSVKEQNNMAKVQHDDTLKENTNNTVNELLDNMVKEKKNLEIYKMTSDVQAPNKTVKETNSSKNKFINSDKSFENMLLQDADKIIEFGKRNDLLKSLKNIKIKNTEKNNEIVNIEKEIERLQSKIMLTNFLTGKLNLCYTEKMEVRCQKTNQEVRHLVSDIQGLERKTKTNTEEVKKVNNLCEQLETNIKRLFEVSDNLSGQIKNINENMGRLSEDMKTQENALKQDLEVISKKQENPYESYMIRAPEIPGLKAAALEACETSNWETCCKLTEPYIEKLSVHVILKKEENILWRASVNGLIKIISTFLKNGFPVNQAINKVTKQTLLHIAALFGQLELVDFLIFQGADVDSTDTDKFTPLHLASTCGHLSVVNQLIKYGANTNAKASNNSTSLCLAARYRHFSVVQALLNAGCDKFEKDKYSV